MNVWVRRLLAVVVGFGVMMLVVQLAGRLGADSVAAQVAGLWAFVLMSVICTAGFGLLVWIPFFWLVGEATLWLLGFVAGFMGSRQSAPAMTARNSAAARPGSGQKADMARYIARMREAGVPDEHLKERLRWAGWTEATVAAALAGGARAGDT